MKAFSVIFRAGENSGAQRWVAHLKTYSRYREIAPGLWIIMSAKSASEIHAGLIALSAGRESPELSVFRVDGHGLDWHLSEGITADSRSWLFENLSHSFPAIRK
jgi:hypothetical protein